MTDPTKPTVLTFDKPDDLAVSIEKLKRSLPYLIEHNRLIAEVRRKKFEAYIESGFTEDQALFFCKDYIG